MRPKRVMSLFVLALFSVCLFPTAGDARDGMTVSLIGMGNIFLIQTDPELQIGPGGGVSFDYRFNSNFSLETMIFVTTHSGKGDNADDDSLEFLGIPTIGFKYYFLGIEDAAFDPYIGLGVGAYAISEGTQKNGTNGVGMGSNLSIGVDYYVTERFSVGFAGIFHSVAIITGLESSNGRDNATALLPYSLAAKVGFHF